MQNRTFLVLLRPIFGEKLKTDPPKEIGCRSCEVHVMMRPEKALEFPISAETSVSISVKTFFFFFGDHLFLGWKNVWISELSEKFRLNFWTNRVILIQKQWKFGSRSFALFSLFQKRPFPNPGYAPGRYNNFACSKTLTITGKQLRYRAYNN